jgi:hypothetical protein
MAEKADGDYIRLTGVTCWMDPKTGEIHLTFNDPDLHHENTGDGARVVFNHSVRSANYHPANYNRFGDALRKHGCTAPDAHVAEGARRLDKRASIKTANAGTDVLAVLSSAVKMMEQKCCHFDWCIERNGVITEDRSIGADDIVDGMHPGCAPYRKWLDRAVPLLG